MEIPFATPGLREWLLQCLCSTRQESWEQWVIYSLSSRSCIPVEQTHGMHTAAKSWIPSSATGCQYIQFCKRFLACSSSTIMSVTSSTWWGTATSTKHHWETKWELLVEGQSTRVLLINSAAPQLVPVKMPTHSWALGWQHNLTGRRNMQLVPVSRSWGSTAVLKVSHTQEIKESQNVSTWYAQLSWLSGCMQLESFWRDYTSSYPLKHPSISLTSTKSALCAWCLFPSETSKPYVPVVTVGQWWQQSE